MSHQPVNISFLDDSTVSHPPSKVLNDLVLSVCRGIPVMILLDLPAAFDSIDHEVFIDKFYE